MSEEPVTTNHERHFRRSESIAELAKALAKAQGEVKGAAKDAANPFFKSKYADLASVIEAIRKPFSDNGLSFMQFARSADGGVEIETLIMHGSGESVSDTLFLPCAKWDAQGIGSAITYGKRYGLQAMAGVPSEDDDGNAAAASAKSVRDQAMTLLDRAAGISTESLEKAWKGLTPSQRTACANDLQGLKAKAAEVTN